MLAVTVIGGYLGAGKTTLVNHLLRHANGAKLAVLVNEFGDLPIDADLIEGKSDNVISISGGCVCCSFGSDLIGALMDLPQVSSDIDHVLIEASGVALPRSIADSVSLLPDYHMDGIAVVADTSTLRNQAIDRYIGDTIERQLEAADLLILNKVDLVDDETLQAVAAFTDEKAPRARRLRAENGAVPVDILLSPGPRTDDSDQGTHPHDHEHEHLHVDDPYLRMTLSPSRIERPPAFAEALATSAEGLLRAKGFFDAADGSRMLLQIVGDRWSVTPSPGTPGNPRLVFIGVRERMSEEAITNIITAHETQCDSNAQGETAP